MAGTHCASKWILYACNVYKPFWTWSGQAVRAYCEQLNVIPCRLAMTGDDEGNELFAPCNFDIILCRQCYRCRRFDDYLIDSWQISIMNLEWIVLTCTWLHVLIELDTSLDSYPGLRKQLPAMKGNKNDQQGSEDIVLSMETNWIGVFCNISADIFFSWNRQFLTLDFIVDAWNWCTVERLTIISGGMIGRERPHQVYITSELEN